MTSLQASAVEPLSSIAKTLSVEGLTSFGGNIAISSFRWKIDSAACRPDEFSQFHPDVGSFCRAAFSRRPPPVLPSPVAFGGPSHLNMPANVKGVMWRSDDDCSNLSATGRIRLVTFSLTEKPAKGTPVIQCGDVHERTAIRELRRHPHTFRHDDPIGLSRTLSPSVGTRAHVGFTFQ